MRLARNTRIHWLLSTRAKTVLGVRLAAAGLSEGLREVLRAAGLRGNGSVMKRSFFKRSSFTLSQYRAAEVLEEAARDPCHLDLAEAVLACVEINQC